MNLKECCEKLDQIIIKEIYECSPFTTKITFTNSMDNKENINYYDDENPITYILQQGFKISEINQKIISHKIEHYIQLTTYLFERIKKETITIT